MGRCKMNDDFIKQFRKLPDSNLTDKIRIRLERKERMHTIKRYSILPALILIFAFSMLMTFSSTVRAEVLQTIEEIAGLSFDVTIHYPGGGDEDVIIIPSEYLSLEEARSRFPSPIVLPTYIPQGYERDNDVMLTPFTNPPMPMLAITWTNAEHSGFGLDILHCSIGLENCGLTVGEGALEETILNGVPAVVIHGAWDSDAQQYDTSVTTAIRWKYDENTIYTISSWTAMSLDELRRIAESISLP
jgi:hypothetical protein